MAHAPIAKALNLLADYITAGGERDPLHVEMLEAARAANAKIARMTSGLKRGSKKAA